MKNILFSIIVLSFLIVGCKKKPEACYTFSVTDTRVQFSAQCSDLEDEYLWNFGDNTTSNIVEPLHTYPSIGSYQATLEVKNEKGSTSITKTISIVEACGTIVCTVSNGSAIFTETESFCGTEEKIKEFKTTKQTRCDSMGGVLTSTGF